MARLRAGADRGAGGAVIGQAMEACMRRRRSISREVRLGGNGGDVGSVQSSVV